MIYEERYHLCSIFDICRQLEHMQMKKRAFQVEELNESRKRGKKILI